MKIALPTKEQHLSDHFGHAPHFTIFTLEGNQVIGQVTLPNPGHYPGAIPAFLKENGANLIISKSMGAKAKAHFDQAGIEVITGAEGSLLALVNAYLEGDLKSEGHLCHHHQDHTCSSHE